MFDLKHVIADVEAILTPAQIKFIGDISDLAAKAFEHPDDRMKALSGGYLINMAEVLMVHARDGRIRSADAERVVYWLRQLANIIERGALPPEETQH